MALYFKSRFKIETEHFKLQTGTQELVFEDWRSRQPRQQTAPTTVVLQPSSQHTRGSFQLVRNFVYLLTRQRTGHDVFMKQI